MVKNIPKTPQNRLENGQNWCQMGTKLTFLSLISLGQKPLRRRLRSRWFTERFHSNPLMAHHQQRLARILQRNSRRRRHRVRSKTQTLLRQKRPANRKRNLKFAGIGVHRRLIFLRRKALRPTCVRTHISRLKMPVVLGNIESPLDNGNCPTSCSLRTRQHVEIA